VRKTLLEPPYLFFEVDLSVEISELPITMGDVEGGAVVEFP
jgi:hypothetical protein